MRRATYSAGAFKPLDAADLTDGCERVVVLDVPRPNRRRPYVKCRFERGLLVPSTPVALQEGEEVEYIETVVAEVIAPGITRHPEIRFGKACIEGTRLAVMDIAALHDQALPPEEILVEYPDVTLEQIGHALAYYRAHPEEIEAEFEKQDRAFDRMERDWQEYVARHGGNPPDVPSAEDRGIARPVDARSPMDALEALAKEAQPFAHPVRFIRIKRGSDGNDR
jgi:uncharacterized protein (DUF433 family)